jgi:hypothetical protein
MVDLVNVVSFSKAAEVAGVPSGGTPGWPPAA